MAASAQRDMGQGSGRGRPTGRAPSYGAGPGAAYSAVFGAPPQGQAGGSRRSSSAQGAQGAYAAPRRQGAAQRPEPNARRSSSARDANDAYSASRRQRAAQRPEPNARRSSSARDANDAYSAPRRQGAAQRPEPDARRPYGAAGYAEPRPEPVQGMHPLPALRVPTPAEMRALCLVLAVVAAVAFMMIYFSATAAATQHDINVTRGLISKTEDEIVALKVEIEQTQAIESVRERAQTELGMKEPSFEQYVYLADVAEPGADFEDYIKGKAYGEGQGTGLAEPQGGSGDQSPEAE